MEQWVEGSASRKCFSLWQKKNIFNLFVWTLNESSPASSLPGIKPASQCLAIWFSSEYACFFLSANWDNKTNLAWTYFPLASVERHLWPKTGSTKPTFWLPSIAMAHFSFLNLKLHIFQPLSLLLSIGLFCRVGFWVLAIPMFWVGWEDVRKELFPLTPSWCLSMAPFLCPYWQRVSRSLNPKLWEELSSCMKAPQQIMKQSRIPWILFSTYRSQGTTETADYGLIQHWVNFSYDIWILISLKNALAILITSDFSGPKG